MNLRMVAGAVVAIVLLAAGILLGMRAFLGGGGSQGTTEHYAGKAISFDYPAAWRRKSYKKESSFSSAIVFLSTARMHDPCVRTKIFGGTTETCGMPVDQLDPCGVVIEWSANGFPLWTLERQGGGESTIAGRPATVREETPGDCEHLGADVTITAAVSRAAPYNWYQMRACLKGPDVDELRRQISLMLASMKIREG